MRFSVIIPVYNMERYLRECLDSVLNQSFSEWEAICVNDGSTDSSEEILNEYALKDNRLKVVIQSNGGLSAARNSGIKIATGDYILFLDSDDWLEPNALEYLAHRIDGEDMISFSGRLYFEDKGQYHAPDQLNEMIYSDGMDYYNDNALHPRDFAFVCVVHRAYRRDFLSKRGLCFKEGIYHEDNLFTPIACYWAEKVKVANACLYNYRVRKDSITKMTTPKRRSDLLFVANNLASFFVPLTGFNKTVVYRTITHHYQVAFLGVAGVEKKALRQHCDWKLYWIVSRTKFRHRSNYLKNRVV